MELKLALYKAEQILNEEGLGTLNWQQQADALIERLPEVIGTEKWDEQVLRRRSRLFP